MPKIKFSIVTPSWNQAPFLEETILSVLNQAYPKVEYFIIDGGSRDGSREILERYSTRLAGWLSEADRGQTHAINKGLEMATGDIFAFINSDDQYLPGAFSAVASFFDSNPGVDWICGDAILHGKGFETSLYQAVVPRSTAHALAWESHMPQPGMFWRRELMGRGFDEGFSYCFDHEFYVRLLLSGYRCVHLPLPLAAYRLHPESKTVSNQHSFDVEFERIAARYSSCLGNSDQRWIRATGHLRTAYRLIEKGDRPAAIRSIIAAAATHPESLIRRPFYGTLRRFIG